MPRDATQRSGADEALAGIRGDGRALLASPPRDGSQQSPRKQAYTVAFEAQTPRRPSSPTPSSARVAACTWYGTEQGILPPSTWVIGMVVGLVLGLVNAFKRQPSPVLISLYTIAQGVFLGGVSLAFTALPVAGTGTGTAQPIVLLAVLATFATFGVLEGCRPGFGGEVVGLGSPVLGVVVGPGGGGAGLVPPAGLGAGRETVGGVGAVHAAAASSRTSLAGVAGRGVRARVRTSRAK